MPIVPEMAPVVWLMLSPGGKLIAEKRNGSPSGLMTAMGREITAFSAFDWSAGWTMVWSSFSRERQSSLPLRRLLAAKKSVPSTLVSQVGDEPLSGRLLMLKRVRVPALVPSLIQTSSPLTPSLAVK